MEEQKSCVCKDMNICWGNLCWYVTAYGLFHHGFMCRRQTSCSQLEALKMEPHEWPTVRLFWHLWWESQCLAHGHYHLLSQTGKANIPGREFDLRNYPRETDITLRYGLQQGPHLPIVKEPPYFRESSSLVAEQTMQQAREEIHYCVLLMIRTYSLHLLFRITKWKNEITYLSI